LVIVGEYVWRRRRNLNDVHMSSEKNFENIVADAILARLTDLIGPTATKSVNSYLEPNVAAKDPQYYDAQLRSICGKAADVILSSIGNEICDRVGLKKQRWSNFGQCLAAARAKLRPKRISS
jgi:hypothetical protein